MSKIVGNTTTTPMPVADLSQTNEKKADFVKNKKMSLLENDAGYVKDTELGVRDNTVTEGTSAKAVNSAVFAEHARYADMDMDGRILDVKTYATKTELEDYVKSIDLATTEKTGIVRFATYEEAAEALREDSALTPASINAGLSNRLAAHCNHDKTEPWGGNHPPTSEYMREYVNAAVANSGSGGSIDYATQEKAGIVRFATDGEMANYSYDVAITPFDFDLRLKDVTLQSIIDKGVHPALPVSAPAVWEYVSNISYNDLKDKPFYEEGEKGYSFIKDLEVGYSFIDWGAYTPTEGDIASTSDITEEIKANHTYILSIDGVENIVTCNAIYDNGAGEALVCDFVFDSSSIMRFEIIQKCDDKSIDMTLWLNIPGESHTISFYDPGDYTLSPLDEKFIPDSIARVDYVDAAIGDIETAVDAILAIQNTIVGGIN